jgi:hypothetical protein
MNKTEAAYQKHLEDRLRAGEIVRCRFEQVKFRLADLAYYTPDFEVQLPDATIEFHEVKPGYRQKLKDGTRREVPFCFEDAKLKIRIADAQFDEFGFLIVFPLKAGGWGRVDFGPHATKEAQATEQGEEVTCGA